MTMKTIFSVYGYGLGHATRSEAIIKSLSSDVRVIASENAYTYFNKRGMNPSRINSFKIGNITKSFSWVQTLFENVDFPFNMLADYNLVKRLSKQFTPNVIVSDTEPVSILYANTAGVSCYFLSNLMPITSEYKRIPSWLKSSKLDSQEAVIRMLIDQVLKKSDVLLSPTLKSYNMGYKVKFTDLIVRKKPGELKPIENIIKEHRLPKDFILVSFGGARITSEYYKTLMPVLKEFSKENFVVSTNNAVRREISLQNLKLYPFINDYLSMLKACKAVICLGGHSTISEAMVYSKPVFVIPIQEHIEQLTNAVLVSDNGLGKSFFFKDEIKPEKLKKELKEFLDNLDTYTRNIKRAGYKGKGDDECAKLIQKATK